MNKVKRITKNTPAFLLALGLVLLLGTALSFSAEANPGSNLGNEFKVTQSENFVSRDGEIKQVLIATFFVEGTPGFCLTAPDGFVECYDLEGLEIAKPGLSKGEQYGWQELSDNSQYCFMGYEGCPSTAFVLDLLAAGYKP